MPSKYPDVSAASGNEMFEFSSPSLARSQSIHMEPGESGQRQRHTSSPAHYERDLGTEETEPLGAGGAGGAADDVLLSMPLSDPQRKMRSISIPPRSCIARWFPTRLSRILAGMGMIVLMGLILSLAHSVSVAALRDKLKGVAKGWGYTVPEDARIHAAHKPQYDDPFNPDDLTFTQEECEAYFPGLWKEIDRSVAYYTEHPFTKEYLELSCDEPDMTHMRVKIYNNRLYIKMYKQSDFTRTQATLALLQQSLITSREPLPNVEFCIGLQDWPGTGKFSLDRSPDREDVWLMPDYAFLSWPEHVGTYHDIRRKIESVERVTPWEEKHSRLLWRGNMAVGTADREAMVKASQGFAWNDIKPVDWTTNENSIRMEDHCQWKYQGFPEGNSYSGRLRYLQNCKTVIVTHQPKWLQHWTHLYNSDWESPDQNIVYIPLPEDQAPVRSAPDGTPIEDVDRLWARLPETMDKLLKDDGRAKLIADNQWSFFRNRYVSPASAACYWRRSIRGLNHVANYTVDLDGTETAYESWVLRGMRDSTWREGVQRRGIVDEL